MFYCRICIFSMLYLFYMIFILDINSPCRTEEHLGLFQGSCGKANGKTDMAALYLYNIKK